MEILNICIEHINRKLCLVVYHKNLSKDIYIINDKYKSKLFDLLLDIEYSSRKKTIIS